MWNKQAGLLMHHAGRSCGNLHGLFELAHGKFDRHIPLLHRESPCKIYKHAVQGTGSAQKKMSSAFPASVHV